MNEKVYFSCSFLNRLRAKSSKLQFLLPKNAYRKLLSHVKVSQKRRSKSVLRSKSGIKKLLKQEYQYFIILNKNTQIEKIK